MALTRPENTPGDPEQPKSGSLAWLWIVMGIILLALLIWWMWPKPEPYFHDVAETPTDTTVTATAAPEPPEAGMVETTIATVRQNPAEWTGRLLSGTFNVVDVPSDRGFWIEQDGQRMFALVIDQPAEQPVDIREGQTLLLTGTVRDASYLPQIEGEDLTETTRRIVEEEPLYLIVDEDQIEIEETVESGAPATTE